MTVTEGIGVTEGMGYRVVVSVRGMLLNGCRDVAITSLKCSDVDYIVACERVRVQNDSSFSARKKEIHQVCL